VRQPKALSASQVAKRYGISRQTAWAFMHKFRTAMGSSDKHPMERNVQVDEFVFGGKETLKQGRSKDSMKKKLVEVVELTETGKVFFLFLRKVSVLKRNRCPFSAEYAPISKRFNTHQDYSDKGNSMKQMHTIIHQVKSWLKSVYS